MGWTLRLCLAGGGVMGWTVYGVVCDILDYVQTIGVGTCLSKDWTSRPVITIDPMDGLLHLIHFDIHHLE